MSGIDFFSVFALPAIQIDEAGAERIACDHFGLTARAESIGSQQDANFLLRSADDTTVAVLKVANPAFSAAEIEAQDEAADLVSREHPGLRVATALRADDGTRQSAVVQTPDGPAVARLLRFLPGGTMIGAGYLRPAAVARLGEIAGQVSRALAAFEHPGLGRVLQWDPRHADRVVELLLKYAPEARRAQVEAAAAQAWAVLERLDGDLPRQAVHLDITDDNVVMGAGRLPDGLIDFSDLTTTWGIAELVPGLASVLHHTGAEPCAVIPAVRAYHQVRPIAAAEAEALWPLVVLRGVALVLSGCQQVEVDDGNAYAEERLENEWRIFDQAVSVPLEVMSGLIRDAISLPAPRLAVPDATTTLVPGLAVTDVATLDLSWDSDDLDAGAWLRSGLENDLATARLAGGAKAVVTRHAEARLSASRILAQESPATVATGVDCWFATETTLAAPWAGTVLCADRALVLRAGPVALEITCDGNAGATGDAVAGDALVSVPARARVQIVVRRSDAPKIPALARPEYAAGWLALTDDPAPLFGLPRTAPVLDEHLLERREAHFATVQEHYYDTPPRIERGWRHHLIDANGRVLLDMVNNVATVGHSHPRIEKATSRQFRRLNTNSRFNYAAVVEYAERLAGLVPDPLDTVFLVNSGSEAADLALRLAMVNTGRHDVAAMREAYHGWTYASDAVSTSVADNPNALTTRPEWVHIVDAPNTYRGTHHDDPSRYGPEAARVIDELAASGRAPAAFIGETYYGNAGGMPLPDGYLAEVYAAIRRHGGLTIGDEIQVGYARLGTWFWGFQQQGVVPDIVIVAKAAGNGHPVGAVITSKAVADRYRHAGYFFSSTGGSPVSSLVGTTVLDIMRDEHLQENARVVGAHLKGRLLELAERHAIIGAVHGDGLYLGVELVRDRVIKEPAADEAWEICDRMLELGVVVQPTSDRMCVLKIKPPLCVDIAAADFFADTLDRVLTEGW
jgi:4-aminobutyrate aminotransferase-like enzyme/Ser/Thr protein kinase RdoA (MazF antagonist)